MNYSPKLANGSALLTSSQYGTATITIDLSKFIPSFGARKYIISIFAFCQEYIYKLQQRIFQSFAVVIYSGNFIFDQSATSHCQFSL